MPPDLDTTRAYVSGSLWSGFGKGDGEFSDGPYGIQEPTAFSSPDFYPWAFNPEASPPLAQAHSHALMSFNGSMLA